MFQLKLYQERTLGILARYFQECIRLGNADIAFYQVTQEIWGKGIPYTPVEALPGIPYVCLRVPTGGGKTIIGCNSIAITAQELLHVEHALVLWLVPSNAIREQTLKALKNREHPYHQSLLNSVGDFQALDIKEALYLQRSTLDTETTIIVSTMQAFRVEDTEGRKVYEESGSLQSHFVDLSEEIKQGLECYENGQPIASLANVLKSRRPLVVVDEAHNARTGLSFETLARFSPSCIIEFTATPDTKTNPSNVLYSVSAAELKADQMIKMPILLETKSQWKELLSDAIACRSQLEIQARIERQHSSEYLRPIMLIQAQPNRKDRETLNFEFVKQCLLDDFRIPADQIAIATGSQNELEELDLSLSTCPVRFIITVQALREGWDCPFAYILCSVAETQSSRAVEQLLGRIMRLPQAKNKKQKDLNKAYAFVTGSFHDIAESLETSLIQNGFQRQEAKEIISRLPSSQTSFSWDEPQVILDSVSLGIEEKPTFDNLPQNILKRIFYDEERKIFTFQGVMEHEDLSKIQQCFTKQESKDKIVEIYKASQQLKTEGNSQFPSDSNEVFSIPVLSIKQGDFFEQFEETHFREILWKLSDCDFSLTESEYPSKPDSGKQAEVDITDQGKIQIQFLSQLHQQMQFIGSDSNWDIPSLINWIDMKIPHPDITPQESGLFISKVIRWLLDERGFSISELAHEKYRLKNAVSKKIDVHRQNSFKKAYQSVLFDNPVDVVVDPNLCFSYDPENYPCNRLYQGSYLFKKHYYKSVGDLKDHGEEFECAQYLDTHPNIKYWVRNLERQPSFSFWLQTSTDKFYPDFVCQLHDGRYLVVEYKGSDRWSNDDSKEKRDIGGLWEERSKGKCLFIMPNGKDFNAIGQKM